MKKFVGLGRKLNKEEQKQITGGRVSVICTCNNCNMETVVCSAGSVGGIFSCLGGAGNYCSSIGCPAMSCNVSGTPTPD